MKVDKLGNEIKVGDKVVFGMGQSMTLLIGEVTKINAKTVTILRKWKQRNAYRKEVFEYQGEYRRLFDNVVVINQMVVKSLGDN